jgi:hypothetical protein
MQVYQGSVPVHTSSIYNLHDSARHFTVPMGERGLALRGDILVKCYHRHRQSSKDGRETVFSLQFHTCAVTAHTLVFQRQDLDDACQGIRISTLIVCIVCINESVIQREYKLILRSSISRKIFERELNFKSVVVLG